MKGAQLVASALIVAIALGTAAGFVPPALVLAGVIVLLAAGLASWWPTPAVVVGLAAIVIVPVYWAPLIPGTKIAAFPVVVVCLMLLPAAAAQRGNFRASTMDRLVAAYVVLRIFAYAVNVQNRGGPTIDTLLTVALPYATFRLLGLRRSTLPAASAALVMAGVPTAIIALREYSGVMNPFFERFPSGYQHAFFARSDVRLYHVRPEASFGHSIALGMFLAFAALLAFALAWNQGRGLARRAAAVAAGALMTAALFNTLVRGPVIMLAFSVGLLVLLESRRGRHGIAISALVAGVILVNVGSFANLIQLRDASFEQGGAIQRSGEYRFQIWETVTNLDNFSLLGKPVAEDPSGFTRSAGRQVGLNSFDNTYALIYIAWGALTLIPFVLIAGMVVRAVLRDDSTLLQRAWAAGLLGAFVNLMAVNLLTQFAHLFWIAIGLTAAWMQQVQVAQRDEPDLAAVAH